MTSTSQPPEDVVTAAIAASLQSPCLSKRGVAVWNDSGLISIGYNSPPPSCACTRDSACKATCSDTAVHAEELALLRATPSLRGADMLHVKTVNGVVVKSGEPSCLRCSRLLLAAGIAGMWLYQAAGWQRYDTEAFHAATLIHPRVVGRLSELRARQAVEAVGVD